MDFGKQITSFGSLRPCTDHIALRDREPAYLCRKAQRARLVVPKWHGGINFLFWRWDNEEEKHSRELGRLGWLVCRGHWQR